MKSIESRVTAKLLVVLILSFLFCVTTAYLKKDDFKSDLSSSQNSPHLAGLPD